jgi:hypothetical protein
METGVVRAMMQFAHGSFQVGWEQSEVPRHPIPHYKEGIREWHHHFGAVHQFAGQGMNNRN